MPFWRRGGKPGNNDLPRNIQEFVAKAVEGPSNYQTKISEYADLNFALAEGLKKRGMASSRIVSLMDSKMIGICAECGIMYTGEWLSYVATLRESGLASKTIGLSSASVRFLEGKCRNPGCSCKEILVLWRPDALAPIDIFIDGLEDKIVEVRKAAAKALGEIPPDTSGYHDPNFVSVTVSALTKALKDEAKDVREAAEEGLDKIKAKAKKN